MRNNNSYKELSRAIVMLAKAVSELAARNDRIVPSAPRRPQEAENVKEKVFLAGHVFELVDFLSPDYMCINCGFMHNPELEGEDFLRLRTELDAFRWTGKVGIKSCRDIRYTRQGLKEFRIAFIEKYKHIKPATGEQIDDLQRRYESVTGWKFDISMIRIEDSDVG